MSDKQNMDESLNQKDKQQQQLKYTSTDLLDKVFNFHRLNNRFKKGIVFVGNSRIGKSTLSAMIAGIKLRKILQKNQVKIQPVEEKYRKNSNLIKHTFTSVTQYPNVHQAVVNGQRYSIIDLPGFKDTSYFKELCNWYYIKSILQEMDQILFVMVVQIHNYHKLLKPKDIEMMERFMQAFPAKDQYSSKQNLITIINFTENLNLEQNRNLKTQIKNNLNQSFKNSDSMKAYYQKSFQDDRLFLFQKAQWINEKQKQELQKGIMFECPQDLRRFIESNLRYKQKTKQSQFKIKNTRQNNKKGQNLKNIISESAQQICKNVIDLCDQLKIFYSYILDKISDTKGITLYQDEAYMLKKFSIKRQIEENELQKIELVRQSLKYSQNLEQETKLVIKIFMHIKEISDVKQFQEMKIGQKFKFITGNMEKFIKLLFNLCEKVFDKKCINSIKNSFQNVWKNIFIKLKIWEFLNFSVQDFQTNQQNEGDRYLFTAKNIDQTQRLKRQIQKAQTFGQSLKNFLTSQIRHIKEQNPSNANTQLIKTICQISKTLRFQELMPQSLSLYYQIEHKKIINLNLEIEKQKLQLQLLNLKDFWDQYKTQHQFGKWVKNQKSQQWKQIKLQSYLAIARYISKNLKKEKDIQLVINAYRTARACHLELFQFLKSIFSNRKNQIISLQKLALISLEVGEYFQNEFKKPFAFQCYQMAASLAFGIDLKLFEKANRKSVELNSLNYDISKYKWSVHQISNDEYKRIVDNADQKISLKLKQQFSNKKKSSFQSPIKQNEHNGIKKALSSNSISNPSPQMKKQSRTREFRFQ